MKHGEIYDKHTDLRKSAKGTKKKFKESLDRDARLRRISFKNYVRDLNEDFIDDTQDIDEFEDDQPQS
ncbi:MAG: hypothetical protein DDT31_00180 [Syntrophomonadaceae bacterium]|nr:hypothetical protein [Bacillota bacterium]